MGQLAAPTIERLSKILDDTGLTGEVVDIASFSSTGVAAGTGIPSLIAGSLPVRGPAMPLWSDAPSEQSGRFMLRYTEGSFA